MAPLGVLCADCGLFFKYMDVNRKNCFKCEKKEACNNDAELEVAEVLFSSSSLARKFSIESLQKTRQCGDCGLVYKFLAVGRTQCTQCENKDAGVLTVRI